MTGPLGVTLPGHQGSHQAPPHLSLPLWPERSQARGRSSTSLTPTRTGWETLGMSLASVSPSAQ